MRTGYHGRRVCRQSGEERLPRYRSRPQRGAPTQGQSVRHYDRAQQRGGGAQIRCRDHLAGDRRHTRRSGSGQRRPRGGRRQGTGGARSEYPVVWREGAQSRCARQQRCSHARHAGKRRRPPGRGGRNIDHGERPQVRLQQGQAGFGRLHQSDLLRRPLRRQHQTQAAHQYAHLHPRCDPGRGDYAGARLWCRPRYFPGSLEALRRQFAGHRIPRPPDVRRRICRPQDQDRRPDDYDEGQRAHRAIRQGL